MDSGSTSKREFYCQDVLWQTFSELALQRRTTEDTLINEAMRSFLQMNGIPLSRALGAENPGQVIMGGNQPGGAGMGAPARQMGMGAQPRMTQQGMPSMGQPGMQPPMGQPGMQPPMGQPGMQPPPISAHVPIQPRQQVPVFGRQPAAPTAASGGYRAPAPAPVQGQALQGGRVPPPSPNYRRPPSVFEDPASDRLNGQQMALASLAEPRQPYGQGPQAVAPIGPQATAQYGQPPLYIIFANQKYTVDKDKYIIGRSSQLADLVIRDANISRKHCAVIYKNGAYYIKDLDSTNGIEFKGNRIDTKRIEEGDVFNICEFSFQFTYR
ncbi:MAG: FHA domain-containing protein [Proteobacteria bacterium]|nr:FHA domain-containing protein [Pseudomonadota bacterium]